MKKIFYCILICIFLSSCSKNYSLDAYFIHTIGFSGDGDNLKLSAVCEKMQGDESEYFVIEEYGESLDNIVKSINKKYPDCYFATAEIYFFDDKLSNKNNVILASELCQSNTFPLKGKAKRMNREKIEKLFSGIKDEDDIKKLIRNQNTNSDNVAVFLAKIMEEYGFEKHERQ